MACSRGVCYPSMPCSRGVCSGGGGACSQGGLLLRGLLPGGACLGGFAPGGVVENPPQKQTATVADGTHPTGMHSCFFFDLCCCYCHFNVNSDGMGSRPNLSVKVNVTLAVRVNLTPCLSVGVNRASLRAEVQYIRVQNKNAYRPLQWRSLRGGGGVSAQGGVCPGGVCRGVSARHPLLWTE